jgi:NAD-dependent deacetylase
MLAFAGYAMSIQEVARLLRSAQRVAVLTGAGVSAESGVPTFRDAQTGLWAKYNPEELATPYAFSTNPKLVWDWYTWRRELVAQATPNPGHFALVTLEQLVPEFTLITQNVDNLHQQAGSQNVIELHGNIMRTRCDLCFQRAESWVDTGEIPPRHTNCGGWLRPDVVWFGENLNENDLGIAYYASMKCDVFLIIGTSGKVYPAAAMPEYALQAGATVVEINTQETPISEKCTYVLRGASGVVLPLLVQAVSSVHEN